MRVLILIDQPNWAYDSIAKSLVKYNTYKDVNIDVTHVKKNQKYIKKIHHNYDRILLMGWQLHTAVPFLDFKKTITGVHGHHAWDDKKTSPEKDVKPPQHLISLLNHFAGVNAVSYRLYSLFKKAGVKNIIYTPNGVDVDVFTPQNSGNKQFVVGYSGSKKHDWRKGAKHFIIPASKKVKVKTKIAMSGTDKYIPLEKMPKFYQQLDGYVCASSSEGFSLSVLEAASCGLPIISTRVGGCTELIDNGVNGFLVKRDINEIADKIKVLQNDKKLREILGHNMRATVEKTYSWQKRANDWLNFIREG